MRGLRMAVMLRLKLQRPPLRSSLHRHAEDCLVAGQRVLISELLRSRSIRCTLRTAASSAILVCIASDLCCRFALTIHGHISE